MTFPRIIRDRNVQFPRRFKISLVAGTNDTYDFTPVSGAITEAGTAINKAYLQPIEDKLANSIEKTGDTITGPMISHLSSGMRVIPAVASYMTVSTGTTNITGICKIRLPKSWSNTMMMINIKGYDYSTLGAWNVNFGGYTNIQGSNWVNRSANIFGTAPFDKIRTGHDGTRCCLLLGTINTIWKYPQILVDFIATYGALTGWETGWSVEFITSEADITGLADVNTLIPSTLDDIRTMSMGGMS